MTKTPLSLFILYPAANELSAWPDYMLESNTAMLVLAHNEKQARSLAADHAGDEGADVWYSPAISTCSLLVGAHQSKSATPAVIMSGYDKDVKALFAPHIVSK
jgi:hypothetical protein